MSNTTVLYEKSQNVALITLNRPERLNAITRDLLAGLMPLAGIRLWLSSF